MEYAIALIVLAAIVAIVVASPLWRSAVESDPAEAERRAALEAAKEAKYREIRDAELDFRMGKLSEPDWQATDRELRSQAIEILKALDDLGEPDAEAGEPPPPSR